MDRRRFLGTSLAAGSGAAVSGAVEQGPSASRPNVIVYFTDQQRWDSVGCYGSPMELTPNLDRVAAAGMRFEYAFTTQPVCGPARSTLQTGKYPTTTGVIHNGITLRPGETTLAHLFKRDGYRTGYVGKWHLGGTRAAPVPLAARGGYDEWWTAADMLERTSTPFEGYVWDAENRKVPFKKYRPDALTDMAVEFIRQTNSKPFLLFLSQLEPHHDIQVNAHVAPPGYAERYKDTFWVPSDLTPYPGDWKSQLPHYYGSVARLDESFGRIMQQLKDQDIAKNTIVVFTSDHGSHFRTRNSEYKRSCHEGSIRIPLILSGPGFERGRVDHSLVSLVDVPPTLLAACGIAVPGGMQGRSLMDLAHGRAAGWRNEVFVQMRSEALQRAIRTDHYKYCIFDPNNREVDEPHSRNYVERYLYDLRSDPHEHVNLIGRPQYRRIADELAARLIARMQETGEPIPKITTTRFYA
jgi:arylsulfatase A-like enzyme